MDYGHRYNSAETVYEYPMPYDERSYFCGEELYSNCTPYHSPEESTSSGYPVWLGLTGSTPMFNHDSAASYEDSMNAFGASPVTSDEQGNSESYTMTAEGGAPLGHAQSIQVATAFHPNHHNCETDMIIASHDNVYFYAHSSFIVDVSPTALERFMSYAVPGVAERIIALPLSTPVLNIILHAIYKTSCEKNAPTCDELMEAVDRLSALGFLLNSIILPDTPLYNILISHAPRRPLDIYALAAHHDLFSLAQYASSHLLTVSLCSITDELSTRIGPRYLRRIFLLQMMRSAALKELVMSVPDEFHSPTQACGRLERQKQVLTRAWAAGASDLAMEMLPETSVPHLRSVYGKAGSQIQCADCRDAFERHLKKVVFRWSEVKTTIQ